MNHCCENCGWSEPIEKEGEHDVSTGRKRVNCLWPYHNKTPDSFSPHISFMYVDEGVTCSCFKVKT